MINHYFSPDINEFIKQLAVHNVNYLIVGGEAVIYYGYARLTGDVDFFYELSSKNSGQLFNALLDFWAGDIPGIQSGKELNIKGNIIQFGQPPNRIDLINSIDGVIFSEAWETRKLEKVSIEQHDYPVYFISLDMLIKNKKASGRYKDLDDLKYLESIDK